MNINKLVAKYFDVDIMSTQRYIKSVDEQGFTQNKLEQYLYEEPCHLSFSNIDAPVEAKDTNPLITIMKVYCSKDLDVLKGDFVEIKQANGSIYRGKVGNPNTYNGGRMVFMLEEVANA